MKHTSFIVSTIFLLFLVACQQNNTKEVSTETTSPLSNAELVKYTIEVEGMTCTGCEESIKKNITKLEGIASISASHIDSVAIVEFDSLKVNLATITKTIEQTGYTVGSVLATN